MYSQSGEGDQAGGQFLAGGSNGPIGGVSSGEGRYTQDHIPGVNIAVIEGVIPNQNREIVMVMYSFGEGEDLILNGMQICSIPEPSATFLVMLSSLGLLRRRRS